MTSTSPMLITPRKHDNYFIQIAIISIVVVLSLFFWQGNKGFDLQDEGFFWYGVQRVMLGEVPILDFMSYDPGRYYWSAMIMSVLGDNGIMALRGSATIFQTLGLFIGLLLIPRNSRNLKLLYLLLSTITLVVWMLPYYKSFDFTVSILLIGALTYLVQSPTNMRYFLSGLCIGFIACFGRNHGVYGIAASIGVLIWLSIRRTQRVGLIKRFSIFSSGIFAGFTPIIFMTLLIPGFASAFWESIVFQFQVKTTNIALPIPWPWLVNFDSGWLYEDIRKVLVGLFFIGIVAFGLLAICWVTKQKLQNKQTNPTLVASSFLALPYAHYAYSRADLTHLSLGIFPLLIGCLALLVSQPFKIKWFFAATLCMASLWVMREAHPGWHCYTKQCVNSEVSGENILIEPGVDSQIKLLRKLAVQYAQNGQNFIATPFWPGAYPLLERKSPMWDIYVLFPRSQAFEKAEIERIKESKPSFIIIDDRALDGREDLRFRNSRPLVYKYITANFDQVYDHDLAISSYMLYKTKRN